MSLISVRARRLIAIVGFAMAMALVGATAAVAAGSVLTGSSPYAVKTVTGTGIASTSSQTYSTVPDMSTTVIVPQDQQAVMIFTFSAEESCLDLSGATAYCQVRILIDGVTPSQP